MKCQVVGCERQAIIDDGDGELCLCIEHQGVTLVHYVDLPEAPQECQCGACIGRRKRAAEAYKSTLTLLQ